MILARAWTGGRAATCWAAVLLLAGCSTGSRHATIYRAEKLLFEARQAESEARLGSAIPDSTALMALRDRYLAVRRAVPGPYHVAPDGPRRQLDLEVIRAIGSAEAHAARLSLEARRADLALESAERLKKDAAGDSIIARQAAFMAVAAYQGMKRYDDAVGAMKDILARFAPSVPPPNAEDPILALPLTIVSLRRNLGDTEGATRELREGLEYYQSLLERPLDPELEAHVRARVIRTALELDLPGRALAQVDSLQILVRRHESLRSMLPEVAFAQGKIRASIDRDPSDGIGILERIATDFPGSPYASQGLFEAASQLEAKGRFAEAKDRYGALLQRYPEAPELAPRAMLRYAALQDRLGDWISAKNTLEALPVRYPQSLAAADAPIAVIQHYMRENRRTAAELYFSKALDTYRTLVERDSTGRFAPVFRVKMFQIHSARNDTVGMYAITEEMLRAEPRHPYTAQVLLEAARAATQRGNPGRAVAYYRRFLHDFPQSRLAAQVRRELKSVGG